MDSLALYQQVCVSPNAPRYATDIALGQVHAAYKTDASVNHDNLAVVAVVHFAGKCRETYFQEGVYLYAVFAHGFKKTFWYMPTTHVIVQYTHFDPFACFLHQCITYYTANGVILKDIKLDMDMVGGSLNFTQQSLQHTLAGGESLEPVSVKWERLDGVLKEGNQAAVVCGNVIGWLGHILQHGLLLKPVIAFPADHALVPLVPAKKEIKPQPDEWEKYQHKYPCQGFYRIAVVEDDNHDDSDNLGQIHSVEDGAGNLPQ